MTEERILVIREKFRWRMLQSYFMQWVWNKHVWDVSASPDEIDVLADRFGKNPYLCVSRVTDDDSRLFISLNKELPNKLNRKERGYTLSQIIYEVIVDLPDEECDTEYEYLD